MVYIIRKFSNQLDNYVISRRSLIDKKLRVPRLARTYKSAIKAQDVAKSNMEIPNISGPYDTYTAESKYRIELNKYMNDTTNRY